jgi:hypothetical protein
MKSGTSIVLAAVAVLLAMKVFEFGEQPTPPRKPSATEMMSVAFVGNFSQQEIRREVERAAQVFIISNDDQSFSRMGSALVALRKNTGVPEMMLLRCARAMGEETIGTSIKLEFAKAAGLCSKTLR